MRLRVAVDAADHHGKPVPDETRKGLVTVLQKLAADEGSMIRDLDRTRSCRLVAAMERQPDLFSFPRPA